MNYTLEKLEKSQIKLSYTTSADEYNNAVVAVYNRTKGKYNIPGFRKGHAPRKVIENAYGPYVFFTDAVNDLVDMSLSELDKEGQYTIVTLDAIDDVDVLEDGGVKYTLTVTVKPEVKLGEYRGMGIEKKVVEIADKEVDDFIGDQQLKQARIIDLDAETPAEQGNVVVIDFVGKRDGVPFEGGSDNDFELELGSGTFIPGFEEQLVGTKAGETKDVVVTFPEQYEEQELAGKEAVFTCTVKCVKKKELPALDDEFAKDISEFSTLEEYRADVRANLQKEAEKRAEREYEDALADKLVELSEVEVPDSMIEREAEDLLAEFEQRLAFQGLKLEQYLTYANMTREQLLDEYKKGAEARVKTRLVMEAFIEQEKIDLSSEDIDAKIEELAEENSMTAEEYRKGMKRDDMNYIVNAILSQKLITTLKQRNEEPAPKAEEKPAKAPKKAAKKKEEGTEELPESEKAASDTEEPAQKKTPAKKSAKKAAPKTDDAE